MRTTNSRGLGIVQDRFTKRWRAMGEVQGVRWLEAWGSPLIEALEGLQALPATIVKENSSEAEDACATRALVSSNVSPSC